MHTFYRFGILSLWLLWPICHGVGAEATLYRALNLNGPELEIEQEKWEGTNAVNVTIVGKGFENQSVALKPPADSNMSRMIRSSIWGSKIEVQVANIPDGDYQVMLVVWEDNHSEQFDIKLQGRTVIEKSHTGSAGTWKFLGPWITRPQTGIIKIQALTPSHGAVNLSGLQIWSGTGAIPRNSEKPFLENPNSDQVAFFENKIRPLLSEHCYECHSSTSKKLKGGLFLDSKDALRKGGDSGPPIVPGKPDASLLLQAVRRSDPNLAMPPTKTLASHEIEAISQWISMGAPDPRTEIKPTQKGLAASSQAQSGSNWWSFRPITKPATPSVKNKSWPKRQLDFFILSKLEAKGLTPAQSATQRDLLRRVTFDLTGLPPTLEEQHDFLSDTSPQAYDKVVNRLLASPRYGEKWARHWLDVVRYADTAGDNSDFPIPQMRLYRDWVIDAFNRDYPFEQFARDQIAGDLLPSTTEDESLNRMIATGYLANSRRFGSRVDDYPTHLTIEDTIDNLGRAFMGLSLSCARCHDHKFDPISAADYYGLYGFFESTRYPWPGIELEQRQRDLVPIVSPERRDSAELEIRNHDTEKRRLQKELQKLKDSLKDQKEDKKKETETAIQAAEKALKDYSLTRPSFELAYAVAESRNPRDATVQIKGDPAKPGTAVRRRFPSVLGGMELPATETSSGRRHLANWIANTNNPLTSRVIVNRIWANHFGTGLVRTPNDFGKQGTPPTHPELLDWLAAKLIENNWSIKSLQREIVLSQTYRLGTDRLPGAIEADPANQWLASYPRRRLQAESIRDTLLHISGLLDLTKAKPHPFPPESEWKFTQHNPFKAVYDSNHRSIFLMTQRIQRHPYLAIFDGADPSASTSARTTSTTPLQALYFLNDPFIRRVSSNLAKRLIASANESQAQIELAHKTILARAPQPIESQACLQYLSEVRNMLRAPNLDQTTLEEECLASLCRSLFRLNEFVYLD